MKKGPIDRALLHFAKAIAKLFINEMIRKCFLFHVDRIDEIFKVVKNKNIAIAFTSMEDSMLRRLNDDGTIDIISSADLFRQYNISDSFFINGGGGTGGTATIVHDGNNISIGGTASNPTVNLVQSPSVFNLVSSGTTYAPTLSGGTIFSGGTNIQHLFAPAGAISAGGAFVQPGNNTTTGGTSTAPTINLVPSPSVFNLVSSGVTFAPVLSGGTIFSGGTNIQHLFAPAGSISSGGAFVQPGNNILTGGTSTAPTVNLVASPSVFNLVSSGTTYAPTLSGGTIFSGGTNIQNLFAPLGSTAGSGATAVARSGSAIIFDVPAEYNSATSPSNSTVTFNFAGAINGTEVQAWFNHSSEPTWPAGVKVVGIWSGSGVNSVRFIYRSGTTVSGTIVSSANGSYTNPNVCLYPTPSGTDYANTTVTGITIPGMTYTILANTRYDVELNLKVTGSTTGGVTLGLFFSGSTGQTVSIRGITNNTTVSPVYFTLTNANGFNAMGTDRGSVSVSSYGLISLYGTIIGGVSNSIMDLRFASFLDGQNAMVCSLGSFMKLSRQ